jgi:hypothetical protein
MKTARLPKKMQNPADTPSTPEKGIPPNERPDMGRKPDVKNPETPEEEIPDKPAPDMDPPGDDEADGTVLTIDPGATRRPGNDDPSAPARTTSCSDTV